MSIDYIACEHCGVAFPDCGNFVSCNEDCCVAWCSDQCADKDGHRYAHCNKFNEDLFDGEYEVLYECDKEYCGDCKYFVPESCKYCRHEDFSDEDLLKHALNKLDLSREELIKSYKIDNNL